MWGGGRPCSVPVSKADEVTKTILNSPRALTASSDRCYCPRESNTTGWVRRERTTRREYRADAQSSVQVQADTQTRGRAGFLEEGSRPGRVGAK